VAPRDHERSVGDRNLQVFDHLPLIDHHAQARFDLARRPGDRS
jgi:hypothetical protein